MHIENKGDYEKEYVLYCATPIERVAQTNVDDDDQLRSFIK